MLIWTEIKIILIVSMMLLIPGWAFLAVSGLWRRFLTLQRWFLAISISIAFYPILFYATRTLLPRLRIGDTKLILMLILMAGIIVWFMRKSWREQFQIGKWGGLILGVLGATLFTRLILAHQYPYPAWTDSLHHTLITDLVYKTGRLPYNLLPYSQTSLDQYHLGMYALTGSLQLLANIPSHTALIWMAQALNGLCVISVFLFLDRKVSRLAGLVGMVVVGLLSFQPAWYFNWGRFTQVSSQAILLTSALITWEAINLWRKAWPKEKIHALILTMLAAFLSAGVFLLHFRVAGNLFPLLAIITFTEIKETFHSKTQFFYTCMGLFFIVLISFALISPVLIPALNVYIENKNASTSETYNEQSLSYSDNPYHAPINLPRLHKYGIQPWLLIAAFLGVLSGILQKNRTLPIIIITWVVFLYLEGIVYRFNIPILTFTNSFEVIIMFYIPASLFVGILVHRLFCLSGKNIKRKVEPILIWLILFLGFIGAFYRIFGIEDYRFLMTKQDQQAMEWIKNNTPADAVFAIHTTFWVSNSMHGTDGGYWIPYFTSRQTTTDTMIASLGPGYNPILERSRAVMNLYKKETNLDRLCVLGVDYIYDGAKKPFDDKYFNIDEVEKIFNVELIYEKEGVSIFKICD